LENWGDKDWTDSALRTIKQGFAQGAVAVKVWKDIGMVVKDPDGHFVLIDDARFDPIFNYVESQGKTLVAHIGEPRNCWLPVEEMTVGGDRSYFKENPQYHAYLHPEIPGYWEQIQARDHVLEKHPHLRVVGCHLGSLEFDVDELAKRLDKYPNFAVDMAARIAHFQVQDREKVRRFILKYQDRLLYGTDNDFGGKGEDVESVLKGLDEVYRKDYRYFGTDQELELPQIKPNYKVQGLELPASVLQKIYYKNALKWYPGI
jgi:predicted TIM-barrel fold metal-dependent hydrolase